MEPCPNCGADIRPTSRFCTSCGYRIPEKTSLSASESEPASSGWGVVSNSVTESAAPVENPTTPEPVQWGTAPVAETVFAAIELATTPAPFAVVPAYPIPDIIAEETINDEAENKVNIAMFHIERLQQLIPDITGWSEDQAASVNSAIASLEQSLKGRESDSDPFDALRETVKAAKHKNRDIDVMVALTDRASEIQDLLDAHDQYSQGVREALIAIKPAAVNYVAELKAKPVRRRSAPRKKTTTTPAPTSSIIG